MDAASGQEKADSGQPAAASDEIALCLSGGGYRAAAFHLGILDMLERLGLIAKVRVLATISGGTLVGVLWTLARARGQAFADFFRSFYRGLLKINVVADAFAALAATRDGGRRPSLARAAAGIYAGPDFAGEAKLGELMDSAAVPDDVLFCATEMSAGLAFRFQASRRSKSAVVGSRDVLPLPRELARELRLADVIAASACFPGAFEPMLSPTISPSPAPRPSWPGCRRHDRRRPGHHPIQAARAALPGPGPARAFAGGARRRVRGAGHGAVGAPAAGSGEPAARAHSAGRRSSRRLSGTTSMPDSLARGSSARKAERVSA